MSATADGAAADGLVADWRQQLLDADGAAELEAATCRLACTIPGVARARLVASGQVQGTATGLRIPLPASGVHMVVEPAPGSGDILRPATLHPLLQAADRLLARERRLTELSLEVGRQQHSDRLQRALFAISELAVSHRDMADVLRGIHDIVGTLMYAENFFIVLRDPAADTVEFLYFADVQDQAPFVGELPLEELRHSYTWHVLQGRRALRGDAGRMAQLVDGPLRAVGTDCADWLGVPILRDTEALGAIVVQSYTPDAGFSAEDQALLEFVASHILTALELKRSTVLLERNVEARTRELAAVNRALQQEVVERERAERLQEALYQVAQLASTYIDSGEFYARIHQIVGRLLNADNFFIALLSDDGTRLEFPYYVDTRLRHVRSGRPLGRGLTELVLRRGEPVLACDEQAEALERAGEIAYVDGGGPRSLCWLGVPLGSGAQVIGVVAVQSYIREVDYSLADQELLSFVASQIATSLLRLRADDFQQQAYARLEEHVAERTAELSRQIQERERVQQRLRHEVMHDALTGLPNRGHLHRRINEALLKVHARPGCRCALLYLDVDRFKVINDSLGHLAGDDFLREVSRRLQACVRAPDLVARLAGDEFVILLEDVALDDTGQPTAAITVARRVLDLLSQPLVLSGRTLEPSASIGIAIADSRYRATDDLVRDADTALYEAKARGGKRWHLFDESQPRTAVDELTMEAELRLALKRDELEPYFQPIVNLADGSVVGHEALMRWNHPQRGVLRPGDFLEVAEDSGIIEAIDWRIFKRACALAACREGDSYLSINVSPRHLLRADFAGRLLALLERTGLAPSRLLIEVTEGSLLDNPDQVRGLLQELQEHGVGVALDDFGTGYSSLSYLHTFPLRMLKIDRTFLAALDRQGNSAAVVDAVLALARALRMDVVAEGIEAEEQRAALVALGCIFGQGYLFGHPLAVECARDAGAGCNGRHAAQGQIA
ncbi:EAL domain-containing protein [Luteimonas sp. MJ246]|uniref:EAL domain-containing protein n=1 Tax=Luteimonas sp. MJ174 TaxID=3129237 RepID=UPI0031BABB99